MTGQSEPNSCKANVSTVYVGENGIGIFVSRGRFISMDCAACGEKAGSGDKSILRLEDLEAACLRGADIQSCRKLESYDCAAAHSGGQRSLRYA
ncbi:hypothetical protein JM93_03785 [Roseibium hamelinense]|uniref:Uncharacterized protein n=1 Tax=Roseibium hamelinense TaxID=150831 RepID=A0A562SL54_9HYPH|nr:hypothetical protein JM93_03785 [Roseibium hamelinense]